MNKKNIYFLMLFVLISSVFATNYEIIESKHSIIDHEIIIEIENNALSPNYINPDMQIYGDLSKFKVINPEICLVQDYVSSEDMFVPVWSCEEEISANGTLIQNCYEQGQIFDKRITTYVEECTVIETTKKNKNKGKEIKFNKAINFKSFETGKFKLTWKTPIKSGLGKFGSRGTFSLNPQEFFNISWSYSVPIILNISPRNTHTDFTIPIRVNTNLLINESKLQDDCDDIRFLNSDNDTEYMHSLHFVNDTNNQYKCGGLNTTYWVKIDELINTSEQTIYMYYGNPIVESGRSNISQVWDSNTIRVYTFTKGEANTLFDVFGNYDGVISFTPSVPWLNNSVEKKVTSSLNFTADVHQVDLNDASSNWEISSNGFTVDTWVLPDEEGFSTVLNTIVHVRNVNPDVFYLVWAGDPFGGYQAFLKEGSPSLLVNSDTGSQINYTFGEWEHVSATYDGNDYLRLYVNGMLTDEDMHTNFGIVDIDSKNIIGRREGSSTEVMNGEISFFRISNINRSEDWHNSTYKWNEYSFGTEFFQNATIPPINETPIINQTPSNVTGVQVDLTGVEDLFFIAILCFVWLATFTLGFVFDNFGFVSLGFFIGLWLAFLFQPHGNFLSIMMFLLNTVIFISFGAKKK